MAPEKSKTRRRNRRRKRRNVSSSSSSSASSSSSSPSPSPSQDVNLPVAAENAPAVMEEDSESSDSSHSSSSSSSSSTHTRKNIQGTSVVTEEKLQHRTPPRSPSPPNVDIPPFIPSNPTTETEKEKEKELKERFRKFWMASVADGFKDDLEEIRKEPNLSASHLSLLIDSLASGADVFSPSARTMNGGGGVNEMEIVLDT